MENQNKYHNSKIYQITDIGYNKCYIGSTTEGLSTRMARHRASYKRFLSSAKGYIRAYDFFNEYGIENCKIALIRRGNCPFSNKVKNAQDAGATAVIIMDSIANNPTRLSMSSTGLLGITIPAVFITKEIGDDLLLEMANGDVNITLESPSGLYLFADGDFDNGIIGHEVGHGISNRLIGGPTNSSCMTNGEQMGEGWSDWFGLMLQIKPEDTGAEARGIGTYAINEPITGGGIRAFPYSTDIGINPLTLADSNDTEPHNRGETWTAVLWDLTWAYINKYGFNI